MTQRLRCSDAFIFQFESALKRLESQSRPDGFHPNDLRRPSSIPRRLAIEEFLESISDAHTNCTAVIVTSIERHVPTPPAPVKKVKNGT